MKASPPRLRNRFAVLVILALVWFATQDASVTSNDTHAQPSTRSPSTPVVIASKTQDATR